VSFPETYSPTVGLRNATHANQNILVNLTADHAHEDLEFFSLAPATPLRVTLKRGEAVLFDEVVTADARRGNRVSAAMPAGGSSDHVQLTITTVDGRALIAAETAIK
jgi:hypothetical protein